MTPKTSRFDGACGHRAPGPTGRRPRGTHAPPAPRLGRRLPLRTWPRRLHTATCAPFLASSPPLHLRLPCGNSAQSSSATSRIGLPAGCRAPGGPRPPRPPLVLPPPRRRWALVRGASWPGFPSAGLRPATRFRRTRPWCRACGHGPAPPLRPSRVPPEHDRSLSLSPGHGQ